MGLGGISIWQLMIILLIVAMIFGTRKLRDMGGDIGSAVKGFKKALNDDKDNEQGELNHVSVEKRNLDSDLEKSDHKPS